MIKISATFPTDSRQKREGSRDVPKDFFYGTNNLSKNFQVNYVNSRKNPTTIFLKFFLFIETILNRFTQFGIYRTRLILIKKDYQDSDIIISFNDAFSINLGLFYRRKKNQKLIGIFHGLSDLSSRVPFFLRKNLVSRLKKSTKNLDFCLFLSEADLVHSRLKYNIQERKSAIFLFGVDKDFWRPINGTKENIDILCVGSDRNRDYEILKEISVKFKIKLLTKIKINLKNNHNIKKISGNFYNSSVSDKDLRHLYNSAKIILIPLRNVFQPSGQSVALQAMACGRTVVITETKGIFDKIVLRNNFNIMFVKPDSIHELNRTISNLLKNESLRNKIGTQARKTILDNFTINHMSKSLEKIINKVS